MKLFHAGKQNTHHVKKINVGICSLALLVTALADVKAVTINFDTVGNWTAGSLALTSYATNHTYVESDWTFTGGGALRQTATAQDGFAGALGTYAWRLQNVDTVVWTGTYGGTQAISSFGFSVRRWDASPTPAFNFEYSTNGGSAWTLVSAINNTTLGNSSNWTSFSQTISAPAAVAAGQFLVRFDATAATERIMVDDFNFTAVPEPHVYGLAFAGLLGLLVFTRMRKRVSSES